MKGLSLQRIHILLKDKRFGTIEIDGVKFIILNDKASKFKAQKYFYYRTEKYHVENNFEIREILSSLRVWYPFNSVWLFCI
jgi:hypothetical protein